MPPIASNAPPDFETVPCPFCGGTEARTRYCARDHLFRQPGAFTFVACSACGLVYLTPRPTPAALARYYPDDYFCYRPVFNASDSQGGGMGGIDGRLARGRIRQLERYVGTISRTSRVLDVGCGANNFLYQLARLRGCDTMGVDFNPQVVAAIQHTLRMPVMCGSLLDCRLPAASFDGVAMYEYIEHEGRPREILAEAHRVTKPGGWLAIETPNIGSALARFFGRKWCQLDAPRHLALYDRHTIRAMLEKCGYELIAIRPLCYQWMFGFSVLVAMGFRNMGSLPLLETALAVACTLPALPIPWLCPEFMRVYARRT